MSEIIKLAELLGGHSAWPIRDIVFLLLLGFNAWFIWKIGTNHLKHIDDRLDILGQDVKSAREEIVEVGERVSRIEGRLEK